MTIDDLLGYLRVHKTELIHQLNDVTYRPKAAKRVEITQTKWWRGTGVPTVIDRMIQQAIAQVMSPIFEQVFLKNNSCR